MWELDYKDSWAPKNRCFWTVVLEKTLESPLYCKEIQPVHPIGNQSCIHWKDCCWSWNSNTLDTWCKELTPWKRRWCWERLKAGGEGDDRGWDGWMASPTRCTWVWANSKSWWWTGKAGVLQSMGLQRVRHGWVTELNWTETLVIPSPVKVIDPCNTSQCFLVSVFWMLYFCKIFTFRKVHLLSQYDDFLPSFFFTMSERVA